MLSFIVPAHDEARQIGAVVAALQAAGAEAAVPFEIVVVDDSSSDGTGAIAERAGARVVRAEVRQIAAARNVGARAARGDVLLFVDGDTFPHGALVRAALAAVASGAVGGGSRARFDAAPWYGHAVMAVVTRALAWSGLCGGCFLYVRRDVFERVGGFDERLFAAEEIALARSLRAHGSFVVLKERVVTSGRKLRDLPLSFHARQLARLVWTRGRALHSRDGLAFWYGRRAG
jgi:glycosyltransferase involved in cell wall biosynthesis